MVEAEVTELQQELWEEPIGDQQLGLRVLLGQGASIADFLMPHETRKVFIHKASDDTSKELITQKFQVFGKIVLIRKFSGGQPWGMVIFRTKTEANAAAEATKEDENCVAQLENRHLTKHNPELKAQLSWNRRPAKGVGFVSVSQAYWQKCLDLGTLHIKGNVVNIQPDIKKGQSLFLTNLPFEVREDWIKRSLLRALQESEDANDIVESVIIPRETVPKKEGELDRFENEIREKIQAHLTSSQIQVKVNHPKTEKTAVFTAEVTFSDPTKGLAACRNLDTARFLLGRASVSVEPVISASLRVSRGVYDAHKPQLDEVGTRLANMGVKIATIPPNRTDSYMIHINAGRMEDLVQARTSLNDVIRGEVLECNDGHTIAHLLTPSGRQMLRETERETAAHIGVDSRLRTVSIHGTAEACTQVRLRIDQYLHEVMVGARVELVLRGPAKPPGLLKALYLRYGEDLDLLRQQAGLHSIQVDYRRHTVTLVGLAESVEKGRQAVEDVERGLAGTRDTTTATTMADSNDSIDCSACFCPIDKGKLYRLQICAHPFCQDCVVRQISIAIKDRHFPICCCHDGCNLPLAWRDFSRLSYPGHIRIPELANASLSAYVLANRDKARFCPTPDCPMVYRVTAEDSAEVFLCPQCEVRTCTACHEHVHDSLTCAMVRSARDVAEGVEVWVSQDRRNRKTCPGCRSPIQKTGGCNEMRCTACGAIFCWLCTQQFPSGKACSDHLIQNHKGIFTVED